MKAVVRSNFDESVSAYEAYERRTGRFAALARLLVSEMRVCASGGLDSVLDAGAGTGASTTALSETVDRLVALDISREMLSANEWPHRIQGDFDELAFTDGSFDAVAYTASLFLVPEPNTTLAEARRVLRDGGVVGAVAPVGWETDEGDDLFETLGRSSRSPTSVADLQMAFDATFETTSGVWSFPTTAADVRGFHAIPAMAARLYPKADPDERVRRAQELLSSLEGTFEERWRWLVGTNA
jgi:SAM-dependent methyltransferase